MSNKSPFVLTLLVSGLLVGWLYAREDAKRPEAAKPGSSGLRAQESFRYPDPRGIVLQLNQRPAGACPGARFRSESPSFALWEDGTVVYRTSTHDYCRATLSKRQTEDWLRELRAHYLKEDRDGCEEFWGARIDDDWTHLRGRDARGSVSVEVYGLARATAGHADGCNRCRLLRPFARLVNEIASFKARETDVVASLPMEVYLEFRSCGCRNHPDIVQASRYWSLAGPTPSERCGRGSTRFRLDNPEEIRWLARAIEQSAAVLDGEEIYTCFMRPLLQPREDLALARR